MSELVDYNDQPWLDPKAVPFIQIQNVSKHFGDFVAVKNINLDIYRGELFCLLGGSGCGKTTLLRMLSGFEMPTQGKVLIDGIDMTNVPPYDRPVNMMFQSYALFPHMTVENNIAYGLKRDGVAKDEIAQRVSEMLAMVELSEFNKRKPHQLSGGQRQRVALARALIKRPKVLLLDEPLAALDKRLREQTQFELMNIQEKLGVTFVVVTHDQEEAMTLSTRIAIMDKGEFSQIGTPTDIYEYPKNRSVADFIGSINMFDCTVVSSDPEQLVIKSDAENIQFALNSDSNAQTGSKVWLAIRPEKINIKKIADSESEEYKLKGVVQDIGYLGNISTYRIKLSSGKVISVSVPNQVRPRDGRHFVDWDEEVLLDWHPTSPIVLTD